MRIAHLPHTPIGNTRFEHSPIDYLLKKPLAFTPQIAAAEHTFANKSCLSGTTSLTSKYSHLLDIGPGQPLGKTPASESDRAIDLDAHCGLVSCDMLIRIEQTYNLHCLFTINQSLARATFRICITEIPTCGIMNVANYYNNNRPIGWTACPSDRIYRWIFQWASLTHHSNCIFYAHWQTD